MLDSAPRILEDKRILVVEDTPENRKLFRAVLQLEGAEVFEASGALQGIEIAGRELPDLILMDIQMPGVDGLEATRRLRADPRTASIPVVAVTASVMERDRNQTIEAGCNSLIAKPIDPALFGQQIASFIQD